MTLLFTLATRYQREFPQILSEILAHTVTLCQDIVYKSYVKKDVIPETDAALIAYERRALRNGRFRTIIYGFALYKYLPDALYLHLICSKGVGSRILAKSEEFAKKLHKKKIQLSALPHVINYYRRLGYKFGTSCREDVRITRIADRVKDLKFRRRGKHNPEQVALRHPQFSKFLRVLIRHGYTDGCQKIIPCYGYHMTKCFHVISKGAMAFPLNLTPHDIDLYDAEGKHVIASIPKSGISLRVKASHEPCGEYKLDTMSVPLVTVAQTESIEGVPEEHFGKDLLVSFYCGQQFMKKYPNYPGKIFNPHSGPESVVRNSEGRIIGVRKLIHMNYTS